MMKPALPHAALLLAVLCAAGVAAASGAGAAGGTGAAVDSATAPGGEGENARGRQRALDVRVVRDNWGIAHIYGKSDADAVFGTIYAQAEDDFGRIEHNYLNGLGILAQAEGEPAIYSDLRQRLFIDPQRLLQDYRSSPAWLKTLLVAWSDGLNYFLSKHPEVTPKVIHHFEPWMALCFTEGSIGGDIESIDLGKLREFYEAAQPEPPTRTVNEFTEPPPSGSNGFAIAPSRSASGHALLWINPHTSFYFRAELQMTSAEGLDAYGAVTWGQFFIYQGFNEHNGWMHTSYGGDAVDEYAESVVDTPNGRFYRYAGGRRRLGTSRVAIAVKRGERTIPLTFTVYRSHHGPIVRRESDRWIAV